MSFHSRGLPKGTNVPFLGMLVNNMERLLDCEELCNVDLISQDGQKIRSHRNILAASSAYFRAMFTHRMRESHRRKIRLENIAAAVLRPLVRFCYTGVLHVTPEIAPELLAAALMLQMQHAVDDCVRFMVMKLTPMNCLGVAIFAEMHNCRELMQQAEKYVRQNFMDVYHCDEFKRLHYGRLYHLLKSNDLSVESEADVFDAMVLWVAHKRRVRRSKFPVLLEHCIRLRLLSPTFLFERVWPAVHRLGGLQMDQETRKWRCMLARQKQLARNEESIKPRKWANSELLSVSSFKFVIYVDRYSPAAETWTSVGEVRLKREEFAAAMLDNQLIITGGSKGSNNTMMNPVMNSVISFNIKTRHLSSLPGMLSPRACHGIAVHNDQLYAVGGYDGAKILDSIERYDAITQTWSSVPRMSIARINPGVAVLHGRLYVVGGHDGRYQLDDVDCYDVAERRWYECASLNEECHDVALSACRDYLYAACHATANAHAKVQRYDPNANEWTTISKLSYPHSEISCAYLRGSLLVSGSANRALERWNAENAESKVRIRPTTNLRLWSLLPVPRQL